MANKSVSNIVLACENQDAGSLVNSVDQALTQKLVETVDQRKREIGQTILKGTVIRENAEWQDTYESYDGKIQEAIDYVVEAVMENSLELENTVQMAAKQYNVSEESLREYFDHLTECTIENDSTNSDDGDNKRGVRNDVDINKRARYE
jgi:hypothetical protein